MDPIEEAMEAMEKAAFFGAFLRGARGAGGRASQKALQEGLEGAGRRFAGDLATGAATTLGAGAVAGIGLGVRQLVGAATKKRQFREMMETNPDLQEHQKSNPRFFNTAYNSIRGLNPSYGKDPVVAGTLMRRMMETPDNAGGILMQTMKPPAPSAGGMGVRADLRAGPIGLSKELF
jgi:hypothetical protein